MLDPSPTPRRAAACAAGLVAALASPAAALAAEAPFAMPRDVSLHGWKTDRLIDMTLVFVAILFLVMVVWMLAACILHAGKPGRRAEHDDGTSKRWTAAKVSIAALIFLGVDGNLFVNSTLDLNESIWNFNDALAHPRAVRIELNARCWAWHARYPGPDNEFNTADDVVVLNDLRVPVDVPVVFQIASTDVMHSFYVPNLRVKQDAIPGMINWAWFQAKETGKFEIGCAQHCGVGHYKMRGSLTVLTADEYDAWLRQASADAVRAYDPSDETARWGWAWKEI